MATVALSKANIARNRKILTISSKRQITIPQRFFQMLGFESEAECVVNGDELVIRPIKVGYGGDFSEQILADLVKEGYSGDRLLEEFRKRQSQIRPAVEAMIAEADEIARGKAKYETWDDVFGNEDD